MILCIGYALQVRDEYRAFPLDGRARRVCGSQDRGRAYGGNMRLRPAKLDRRGVLNHQQEG